MRRGRARTKKGRPGAIEEARRSTTPIVVVCQSDDWGATAALLSKTGQWRVILHYVDGEDGSKWRDRLNKSTRLRRGPPSPRCHVMAMYREENPPEQVQNAVKEIGESVEITTVSLLDAPDRARDEIEAAMLPGTVVSISDFTYRSIRELWSFQDANDSNGGAMLQVCDTPTVVAWPALMWRWNVPRLQDLYLRLRSPQHWTVEGESKNPARFKEDSTLMANSHDVEGNHGRNYLWQVHCLRRDFEKKARSLLEDSHTKRAANSVLSATPDACLFGRIHACASFGTNKRNPEFLVASEGAVLGAHQYATATSCIDSLEQLQAVSEPPLGRFSILVGNPMITACLLPALFRTGVEMQDAASRFDAVLGSSRIWEEHIALKACVLYMFGGRPGLLWQLAIRVVKGALPKTWELLLREPMDEAFLMALLHPDAVEAGRLRRDREGGEPSLLPPYFEDASRIYALGRFVRSLPDDMPRSLVEDDATRLAVASTMKIMPDQLDAVVEACSSGALGYEVCEEILRIPDDCAATSMETEGERTDMTPEAREILAMLGMFLNRDRTSIRDATRDQRRVVDTEVTASYTRCMHTARAMADCAMYCGTVHWLAADDEEEEGVWTCLPCKHRWQKRGAREAYQTRKCMDPMKLVPFKREEFHDPEEWDAIMDATGGDVSKFSTDSYWGHCSAEGCGRICPAVPRSGACAETDGVPLEDFQENVVLKDGSRLKLRQCLKEMGPLGPNGIVSSDNLSQFFKSEEILMYLPGPVRRRVRNCIDKSTYILPKGILCAACGVPEKAIDEYCPYCGTGFEPVFACVRYSCPHCRKSFCKACLGINGVHFPNVYSNDHVCWKVLGNRYSYHNKGLCARCKKERPWPKSHALKSAGPEIRRVAQDMEGGMPLETAVAMQSSNLRTFTDRYEEGAKCFEECRHTVGLGKDYCHCGGDVDANEHDDDDNGYY